MDKIKYSPSQQLAIESPQKQLLVSASAGSGKTKVLIERIANIISQKKACVDEMLVVTFTNLASLEMKTRLKSTLEKLAQDDNFFDAELDKLNTASISTLHKFCQSVIREFFYEVQLDPSFSVLDESQAKFLKTKAIEQTLAYYTKQNDALFEQIYQIFFENRNDDALKQNILNIHSFLKSKPDNYFNNMLNDTYSANISENLAVKYIQTSFNEMLNFYINKFSELLILANQLKSASLEKLICKHLECLKMLYNKDYFEVKNIYNAIKFATNSIKKATAEESEILQIISADVKSIKENLEKFMPCFASSQANFETEILQNTLLINKFNEIILAFDQNYSKLKLSQNALDFDDLEHYALKILNNNSIKQKLQSRYKYIFVDEYQDTNEIQEKIIEKLVKDNSLFMVGDVKQSIYMFRQCNPQIFVNKMEKLKSQDAQNVINLNANFRSDKDILYFSNLIFSNIMKKDTACLDYKNTSQFVFGETVEKQNLDLSSVNLCLIDKQKQEKDYIEPPKVYSLKNDVLQKDSESSITKEAKLIFEKICDLLTRKIFDPSGQKLRDIEYQDIAILVRTRSAIKEISQVLISLGVPVNCEYQTNLFEENEVKILIDFLSLLQNQHDDLTLVSVLKSNICGISDYDLIQIRQAFLNIPFYEAVQKYAVEKTDEIAKKLAKLFAEIKNFSDSLISQTVSELLVNIIAFYNLEGCYYNDDDYLQKLKNMEMFVEQVRAVDSNNLAEILAYIDNFTEESQVISIKTSTNSVYVGTIHSSKGLEYPVVFVADTNHKFSTASVREKLIKNGEFGIALSSYDIVNRKKKEGVIKNILKMRVLEQEKQEEMRMLYVALTRAKNFLFVVGSCELSKIEKLDSTYQIKQASSYLDYIVGSLETETIQKIKTEQINQVCHYSNLEFNLETYQAEFDNEVITNALEKINVDVKERQLTDYLNLTFEDNGFAFKNTVTALLQAQEDYNITDFKIKKSIKHQDEDFLLIGTNYHKVMEMLDFSGDSVESQIGTMLKNGELFTTDMESVDQEKIVIAFDLIKQLIEPNDVILKEKPFMTYMPLNTSIKTECAEKVLVQGVADLMIVKTNEIILIDYKTSRLSSEQSFITKYHLQLDLYKQAIEKFYKKPVNKKYIYSFYLNKLIIVWQMQNINIIILMLLLRIFLINILQGEKYGRNFECYSKLF